MPKHPHTLIIESDAEICELAAATALSETADLLYNYMIYPADWDERTFPVTLGFTRNELREICEMAREEKDEGDLDTAWFTDELSASLKERVEELLAEGGYLA